MGQIRQPKVDGAGAQEIRSQVDRIVADERFIHSGALCRFLRYTVEETLQGRGDGLKECVLGIEVFARGKDFDARLDPIVRVQAGRLRSRLQLFYEERGGNEPVRIEYPKGSYTPVFRRRSEEAIAAGGARRRGSNNRRPRRRWLALAAAALIAAGAVVWFAFWGNEHAVTVSRAVRLTANAGVTIFPAVSRNGSLLAYCSDRGGSNLDLWLQPLTGGEPIRLSNGPGAALTPDFSPDGTRVVYRSNREHGGLYVVSVFGGDEQRLTEFGWRPRYSPDGNWIVFQGPGRKPGGAFYIIPAGGGDARLVNMGDEIDLGGEPIWTPDNKYVVFVGFDASGSLDWWVVPAAGGKTYPAGLAAQLRLQGLGELHVETAPGGWLGNEMVFALVGEEMADIWHVPFSPGDWRVSGTIRQFTSGSAVELSPRVSATNRIVFSSDSHATDLWSLRTTNAGGALEQLTQDRSLPPGHFRNPIQFSAAGDLVVFASQRAGNPDVWIKNVATGEESALVSTPAPEVSPLVSPDGLTVAYAILGKGPPTIYLVDTREKSASQILASGGALYSWLPGGEGLLYGVRAGARTTLATVDRDGTTTPWDQGPNHSVVYAAVSPDERWLAATLLDLSTSSLQLWMAPMKNRRPAPVSEWIRAPDCEPNGPVVWAPTSDRLYYFGEEDAYRCIRAVEWNGVRRGPIEAIRHFHSRGTYPWNSWLAISGDRLVFALTQSTSNIWSVEVAGRIAPKLSGPRTERSSHPSHIEPSITKTTELKSLTSTPASTNAKCVGSNRWHRFNDFSRSTARFTTCSELRVII